MSDNPTELRLRGIRFNLLAKNLVSGVAVLLTPGLIFLVSLVVLFRLLRRVGSSTQGALSVNLTVVVGVLIVVVAAGAAGAWLLIRFISRSITDAASSVRRSAQAIAAGDFTVAARGVTNDELSDLARVMNETRLALSQLMNETRSVYHQVSEEQTGLNGAVDALGEAGGKVGQEVDTVTPQARMLAKSAAQLAAAAAEISSSRSDIARHTEEALTIGYSEVEDLAELSQIIQKFQSHSQDISVSVDQIAQIAERTSLLALNATIESAKAGEIGAGFAVVAGQIKELAVQTSTAAAAVTEASAEIQERCDRAVGVTADVTEKLNQINDSQQVSAQAVADQAAVVASMEAACAGALDQSRALSEEIETITEAAAQSQTSLQNIDSESDKVEEIISTTRAMIHNLQMVEDAGELNLRELGESEEQS
ncbi:methyl-accepting chemotaxis protein [uncultured Mobiluncus sp.]|uniref:methyl-accepting chemotaxis protein n=1 Tax=uncultured Mobiluncus sp. TaxID=293425 RepID=UPI0027D9312A|nr:methyl-accepting chemotaxis protein [uncultured Mobiluncus sp.]